MQEVPPCVVSNFVPFTSNPSLGTPSHSFENTFGCVSRNGTWSWIAHGSLLQVFNVQTKERCAVCCFGAKSKSCSLTITAIEEFSSTHLSFPCLLVGLDTSSDGGLLCVFNVKTSKVISAIQLPYKVTSLTVVSSIGGATMETYMLNNQLRYLFGIAAVGTEGGNVLLVDLCLDAENYSDEMMPNKATIFTKTVHNLSAKREVATTKNQHLCILLNDDNFSCDTFEYRNSHTLLASFSSADVIVSALKYIRNLAVLVVGFNFGGIQLWNMQHLTLEISIPIHSNQQPLVHFAFQEPENDPRNFCYVWAIRGHYQGENYRPENASIATLYALSYGKRDWIPRYGYFYERLQGCTKRFEYALTSDPYNPRYHVLSHCSRLISCDVISQSDILSRLEIEDPLQNEEWGSSEDLGLCLMAWENWPTTGEKPSSSYLALFDINQWYQAQMPSLLRCNYGEMCSYLGVFSLKEVSKKMNMDSLLGVSLVPNSLSKFKSLSIAEETFFPSSMSFRIWCLSMKGILQATYLGAQRQLLAEMNISGPNILIDPKELYKRCLTNGLLNHLNVGVTGKQLTVARQRETLLTLALEHSMIQFLSACVQSWRHIEYIHAGCSSKFLLDWVWKITTQIKTTMDKLCQPLFNCSGQALDENALITLHIFKSRLKYLSDVITAFLSMSSQTEQGQQELQLRIEIVDSLSVYLHVLMWLYDCKLLPEHPEGDEYGEDEVAYPITLFNRTYLHRRSELQKIHSSICGSEILLVDGLVTEFGDPLVSMWENKGGSRNYPPPSIYAAISSYLIDGVTLSQKHMLMYYLLLDMATYLSDRQSHLLEKLSVFCLSNGVSSSLTKLTQAFWHLDHQEFEVAVTLLADPVVLSSDITRWQHMRIIKSLLYQNQPQLALKYISIRTPPEETEEEIKLHLSVLLANRLIGDAFMYLRQHQNERNIDDLLNHMFHACQQTHCLEDLLQLPLIAYESVALSNYLHSCGDPKALEVLIMYHLLHCQPLEALSLNERLITQVMERGTKNHDRAIARNALVTGFVDTLPEEQRRLAQELNQIYSHIEKREANPKPLSANVTFRDLTYVSYADMLKNIMDKFSDSIAESNTGAQTPFRSWKPSLSTAPFIRPPITPESRKRKRVSEIVTAPVNEKSSSAGIDCADYSTPLKRARSFDIRSFKLTDSISRTKSAVNESLLSLLQTPPVNRLSSAARNSKISSCVSESTPLSILKTKISNQQVDSSTVPESLLARTPSLCSEISKDDELSDSEMVLSRKIEDSGHSRHLRFQMPSMDESFKGLSQVSPRRPLHEHKTSVASSSPGSENGMHLSGDEQYFPTVSCFEGTSNTPDPLESLFSKTYGTAKSVREQDYVSECPDSTTANDNSISNSPKRTISENVIVELSSRDNSINPDASLSSMSQADETVKGDRINSESDCSFKSVQSEEVGDGTPVSSKYLHESAKAPECDLNQSSIVPESDEKMEMDIVETEIQHSSSETPEKEEVSYVSHTTTHYLRSRSRSRSKSASPARTPKKNSSESPISKSVALFTVSEADQKETAVPNVDSVVPLLEAELPHPCMHTPEEDQDSHSGSPGRITRSRSRSNSASPSRLFARNSPKAIMPRSIFKDSLSELDQKTSQVLEAEMPHPGSLPPEDNKARTSSDFSPPYCGTRSKSISPSRRISRKTESDSPLSLSETEHVLMEESNKKEEKTVQSVPFSSDSISPLQSSKVVEDLQHDTDLKQSRTTHCEQNSEAMDVQAHETSTVQETASVPESIKRQEENKIHKVTGRKERITKKKNIKSVKTARKLKFSFSNPHSSADSEILEALSSTPNTSISSFVFSPPASRTRTRQKLLNETLNSSSVTDKYLDVTSEADLTHHEDVASTHNQITVNRSSRQKKKATAKFKKSLKQSDISSPHNFINFISPVTTSAAITQAKNRTSDTKHSMVLRKTSKKTVKLF